MKHFVGYGASEAGRDYVYTEISRQTLWDTYLIPYQACVKAGAATLMSAFNDISGTPATSNYYTLTEVLKKKWGHQGFVVSDWDAIRQLILQGAAKDEKEAGYKAFTAGVEMDMVDNIYLNNLKQLLNEDKIAIQQIDDAVSRILRIKFQLGLFDKPITNVLPDSINFLQPDARKLALEIAEQSIVLLKNNNKVLPLAQGKKIALIGPIAKDQENVMGSWQAQGNPLDMESILAGMQKVFGEKTEFNFAKGCDFEGNDKSDFAEALDVAKKSDIVLLCLGEKRQWSGENASRASIALPQIQEELVFELKKAGKPIVLVLSNGRPLELIRIEPLADAILEIWQPGIATGTAVADIISGKVNPSGKLSVSYPLTTGQVPCYYNKRHNARQGTQGLYQDISSEPLYPFAYGLSYTEFKYDTLKVSNISVKKGEKLTAEINVTNVGDMDGFETVHWFMNDPYASVTRPIKELKNFEKKFIKKGETVKFKFIIDPQRDLSFPDETGENRLEAGDFYLIVKDQKIKFELKN